VRLSRLPVATIAEILGRARGAGSEFVLATDIRFASQKAVLGQFEAGVGAVPGGGPMARLGRLAGRGRALEILLGGDDIPAALAAEYGYVNRVIPDDQIEGFTDAFARRIAAFDKVAVTGIKQQVDVATLPADGEFAPGLQAYFATAGPPGEPAVCPAAARQRAAAARRHRDQPRHRDREATTEPLTARRHCGRLLAAARSDRVTPRQHCGRRKQAPRKAASA
jgi:enoyl-CoA hydratase/carnithine racemase